MGEAIVGVEGSACEVYPDQVCAHVPGGKAAPPGGVGECVFRLFAIRETSLSGANERWQDT